MKTKTFLTNNTKSHASYPEMSFKAAFLFWLCLILLQSNLFCEVRKEANNSDEIKNNYSDWKVVSITSEIEVYERWIYFPEKRKTRERKGVFYVTNEVKEIVEMTSQAGGVRLWMTGVEESKDLDQQMVYLLFHVPWPFSDKDLVAKVIVSDSLKPGCATIHYSAVSEYLPLNPEADRLLSYEATWTITKMNSGLTKVVFTVFSDTPPIAPRWIQDPVTLKLFKKNLLQLRELLINHGNMELNAMNQ